MDGPRMQSCDVRATRQLRTGLEFDQAAKNPRSAA